MRHQRRKRSNGANNKEMAAAAQPARKRSTELRDDYVRYQVDQLGRSAAEAERAYRDFLESDVQVDKELDGLEREVRRLFQPA
jgi:hypothetical protein